MKNSNHNLLQFGGELYLFPDFLEEKLSDELFNQLKNATFWRHETITIFGKQVLQPRFTAFMADENISYTYSGRKMNALPFHPLLIGIRHRLEETFNAKFNCVLLNYYRNGNDSMGWHRDNEKELGNKPIIASLSLGAARAFKYRDYKTKKQTFKINLEHGSLLLMKGDMQTYWEHCVPKQSAVSAGRINLTFRQIN